MLLSNFTALIDWLFSAVTTFVMSEPICYVFGIFLFGFVVTQIVRLTKI